VRRRVRELVGCLLDDGSTVLVVSKGDQELLAFESRRGWHFLRTADGKYAGHHPGDSAEAIADLEQLRREGAHYFLLPSTYFWWLDEYDALAQHLRSRYRLVADCPDTCLIYDLRGGPVPVRTHIAATSGGMPTNGAAAQNPLLPAIRALLDSLLPNHEPVLVASEGQDEFLQLGRVTVHFPDDSHGQQGPTRSLEQGEIAAQLTAARARGIRYLVVPATTGRGADVIQALREHGRAVATREGICAIYEVEPAEQLRSSHD
jgi:hypothetical protein